MTRTSALRRHRGGTRHRLHNRPGSRARATANGAAVSQAPVRSSAWIPTIMALTLARPSWEGQGDGRAPGSFDAGRCASLESASWPATTEPHDLAPGTRLPEQRVRARNLFRDAANRIHDDAVARQHGYAGALVAGVTIYGYLTRVAVTAWGPEWLRRGTATRSLPSGRSTTASRWRSRGRVVGAVRAAETAGEASIEIEGRDPARRDRGDHDRGPRVGRPRLRGRSSRLSGAAAARLASRRRRRPALASVERARRAGCSILDAAALARAADDLEDPSPLYRGAEAVAHPGLLLRQANRALAENVALGPWIHVASDVAHCGTGAGGGPARDARPRRAVLRAEGTRLGRPRSPDPRRRRAPDRPHPPHRHLPPVRRVGPAAAPPALARQPR